jgi:2-desacetyl-2-hydroxyethyl bacteriochlorophyllide A dehydrogenase
MDARAIWLAGARRVEVRDEVVPQPDAGEIRVRAIVSAVSHGTEMLVYRGQVPQDTPLDLPTLAGSFRFPIKYGYASVGRVIDTGPEVEGFASDDLVFVLHPHQDIYVAPVSVVTRLPDDLAPELGLFTANLETAVNVLLDTPLKLGETAVVFGQGVVGLLVTQLLKRAGAGLVVAVDPLERRRDEALVCGADLALAPGDDVAGQVRKLSGGRGADIAVEVSGSGGGLQGALDVLADEGTVVAVSWYGTKPVTLMLGGHFHRGRVRIRSSQVGRIDPALAPRWDYARRSALVCDLLPRLRLAPLLTQRVPFEDAADAYRLIDSSPEDVIQVALTYGIYCVLWYRASPNPTNASAVPCDSRDGYGSVR